MVLTKRVVAYAVLMSLLAGLTLAGCTPQEISEPEPAAQPDGLVGDVHPISSGDLKIVTGQRLYVPAYSAVYSADLTTTHDLTIMLSVRNTDFDTPIIIDSIQYFDSDGNLVKEYVEEPLELPAMATSEVVIDRLNQAGGTGANFIVVWGAETPVFEPVVEALMTSTAQQQGLSFLSEARVLEEKQ